MDNKKVDFRLTPRVDFANSPRFRTRAISSTPYSKSNRLLQFSDLNFEDSQGTTSINNTVNLTNREKSTLYPQQNHDSTVRMIREFELLSLKFLNQKCERLIDESTKKNENLMKKSMDLLHCKQEQQIKLVNHIEKTKLLNELFTNTDLIVNYLNKIFPGDYLDKIDAQLKQYKQVLQPTLDSFEITDIVSGECLNELFEIVKTPELVMLMKMNNGIKQRKGVLNLEKFERKQQIERIGKLLERYLDLVETVKCLDRKGRF